MLAPSIALDRDQIREFCERNHIRKFSIFGSALRADFMPSSDLDVLVEFEPAHVPGLKFFAMQDELSQLVGRQVDLNTKGFLSEYFREQVLAEAQVVYEHSRNPTRQRKSV
jgi:predicted nucleotidyltransferase